MKDKTLRSQVALVFCGHGSSSKLYKLDFLNFINKIKQKFPNNKIFHCFIEKDRPMIRDCLSEIYFKFNKIIFIPLLIFQGKHYQEDILNNISTFNKQKKSKIIVAKNLKLGKKVASITEFNIKTQLKNTESSLLILLSSFSKKKSVYNSMYYYSKLLLKNLKLNDCLISSFGNENSIIKEVKKKKEVKIFLHPIFLFNGFLYDSIVKKFTKEFKERLFVVEPFLQNENFFYYVYKKVSLILQRG